MQASRPIRTAPAGSTCGARAETPGVPVYENRNVTKRLQLVLLVVVVVAAAVLVTRAVTAPDGREPTTRERTFLRRVAQNGSVFRVDYSAIPDRDLLDAGYEICRRLGDEPGTPDGIDLEGFTYKINEEFDFQRARPEPGAEQDPGVPLRNADLRLSGATAHAAIEVLCPDLPFNPAR